jgi:hypothetical protein
MPHLVRAVQFIVAVHGTLRFVPWSDDSRHGMHRGLRAVRMSWLLEVMVELSQEIDSRCTMCDWLRHMTQPEEHSYQAPVDTNSDESA